MISSLRLTAAALGSALAVAAGVALFASRAVAADGERVATISDIMNSISKSNMGRISSAVKKSAPTSDKGWLAIERAGAMLNEVSFIIVQEDRVIDDVWKKAAGELRAASAQLAVAAKAKDFAGVKAAVPKIGASCKSCHDVHRE